MAVYTPTKMFNGALATSSATIYTAPSAAILKEILITNTSADSTNVVIAINGNQIFPGSVVFATTVVPFDLAAVLNSGDVITAFASVTGVNLYVSGVVIS